MFVSVLYSYIVDLVTNDCARELGVLFSSVVCYLMTNHV